MNNDFLNELYKGFEETIKKHHFDMLQLFIYYCCTCYQEENFRKFTTEEKQKILYFIYKTYMKDENHIDLGYICDKAMENKEKILKEDEKTFSTWDLLEICYEQLSY